MQEELDRIVRIDEVVRLTGRSRTTLWRACRDGQFPVPFKISSRAIGWKLSEIVAWMDSRPRAGAYSSSADETPAAPLAAAESK